jgi:hypothetical protein
VCSDQEWVSVLCMLLAYSFFFVPKFLFRYDVNTLKLLVFGMCSAAGFG